MLQNGKSAAWNKYAAGAAAWFISAVILLLAAAAAAGSLGLDEDQIGWLSGVIVFFSAAAAGIVCKARAAENNGKAAGILLCTAISVCLLILGIAIDGNRMSVLSALRTLLCGFLGSLVSSLIPIKKKQGRGKKRFTKG